MVQLNGRKRNNFFCRRVYSCPGLEGSGDYSFEMENSGRENTYLALPNPSGYITVYPPKMIERLEEKVSEASLSDPQAQSLLMELFSKADSFGCDKQGRINLSDKLLEHAGIKGKAVLVGKFSSFAIWSEDRREAEDDAPQENIFDAMRELGL